MSVNLSFRNGNGQFTGHNIVLGSIGVFAIKAIASVLIAKASEKVITYCAKKLTEKQNAAKAA